MAIKKRRKCQKLETKQLERPKQSPLQKVTMMMIVTFHHQATQIVSTLHVPAPAQIRDLVEITLGLAPMMVILTPIDLLYRDHPRTASPDNLHQTLNNRRTMRLSIPAQAVAVTTPHLMKPPRLAMIGMTANKNGWLPDKILKPIMEAALAWLQKEAHNRKLNGRQKLVMVARATQIVVPAIERRVRAGPLRSQGSEVAVHVLRPRIPRMMIRASRSLRGPIRKAHHLLKKPSKVVSLATVGWPKLTA